MTAVDHGNLGVPAPAATPPLIFSQGFTNPTATGFTYGTTGTSAEPCLTAGTNANTVSGSIPPCNLSSPDASGSGALRLTGNSGNQSGFVIYNSSLNESQGLEVIFDLYMYDGTGADGISFFIVDGSYSPTVAGANGGSLGYAQKSGTGCCDAPGLVGGFIGIGFDSYGNYSDNTEGRVGGAGFVPETVAIRGAASTSYNYITGYLSNGVASSLPAVFTMTNNTATSRPTATMVRIILSTSNDLTVDMDPGGTGNSFQNIIPSTNLNAISGQPAFPSTFKFGWAASTGGSTDIHEVQNFVATNAPPYLTITKQHDGTFSKGGTGTYTIQPNVNNVGGNADQTITVTDTLPAYETYSSATGTNWSCANASGTVTCTYTGSYPVLSGTALPAITLTVNLANSAKGSITNSACISSSDMYNPSGTGTWSDCGSDVVTVGATSPFMTIWKRITQVVRTYGYSTPQTITPTPDPTSPPGVLGTASSLNVDPGDILTYTLYFSNSSATAYGSCTVTGTDTSCGPTIQDQLSPNYVYQSSTASFTCCSNPASTASANFSATSNSQGTLLQWIMQTPLPQASPSGDPQGSASYQVKVP